VHLLQATVEENRQLRSGVQLLKIRAPLLAQTVQPGQYVMLRCAPAGAADPLLRRPFFVHDVQGDCCSLLVHVRGRGTTWLGERSTGEELDLFGPLGHGWRLASTVSTLLLVAENEGIVALTLLARRAVARGLGVTLLSQCPEAAAVYPAALLPEEVEYQVLTADGSAGLQGTLVDRLGDYLDWADAVCLAVSRETLLRLYRQYERLRLPQLAQATLLQPLVCATGSCLACSVELRSGPRLICRDGPVFSLREIALGAAVLN
jgi:dihydroorotate dehydrogenase electron transfer subunit